MSEIYIAKKLLVWDTTLPNDVLDSNVDKGCDLLEELVTIQDTDVLVGLLDFFTDENEPLKEEMELSRELGWEFVVSHGEFFIYRSVYILL